MSTVNEGFDHMTMVVEDLEAARRFFGLLGFKERLAVVASGEEISSYMGIPDWEADHVTLELAAAPVHQEVQLLRFHRPAAEVDKGAGSLRRTGFSHVCFRVADLDGMLADHSGVFQLVELIEDRRPLVFRKTGEVAHRGVDAIGAVKTVIHEDNPHDCPVNLRQLRHAGCPVIPP